MQGSATPPEERIVALDALRGLAVMGILLVNVTTLSGHDFIEPAQKALFGRADQVLNALLHFFVTGKFYSLFSFLFGVGFAIFMQRAQARGGNARRLFRRRMAALLVIGLVHGILIWFGDILSLYALFGFLLLLFWKRSDKTILLWAAAMVALPIALYLVMLAIGMPNPFKSGSGGGGGGPPPFIVRALDGFAFGGYADVVRGNAVFFAAGWIRRILFLTFPTVFGMFLLGCVAGRRNVFADLTAHRPLFERIRNWGLLIAVPTGIVNVWLVQKDVFLPASGLGFLQITARQLSAPSLAAVYVSMIALALERRRLMAPLSALVPLGRMALTNYLLQSVLAVVVFYGIGFGLFRNVNLATALAVAAAIVAFELVASSAWLARFRQGPVEGLWRRLTYGRSAGS